MSTILRTPLALLAISVVTLAASVGVFAYPGGPGKLDLTFNGTGYKFDGFGGGQDWGNAAVVQPDGKIVVAGYSYRSSEENSDVALARYNADGTLDISFGDDGKVVTTVRAAADQALALALQPDGKIVAAGYVATNANAGKDFLVVRYHSNGTLDTSFGSGGKVITPIVIGFSSGSDDQVNEVALQPDGKIVVAGTAGIYSAIARYNSNGSLDGTFGGGVVTSTPSTGIRIFSMAVQPDGKIVAAGATYGGGYGGFGGCFALLRYNSDGTPDATFDGDGAITTVIFNSSVAYSVALQPDGKIVAGGHAVTGQVDGDYDFAIVRYNADGSLDTSFDGDGKFTTGLLFGDTLNSIAVQPDGKIVGAGYSNPSGVNPRFSALRCNPDGSLDGTFGAGGKLVTDVGGTTYYADFDRANSVILQPDGRIIAAGISRHGGEDFALVRYNSDGTLDPGFNGTGKVLSDVGNNSYQGTDVVVQPDGKIISAVYGMSGLAGISLVRYNPDGSSDNSFGVGGKVRTYFFPVAAAYEVLLQPDGKIVVAGSQSEETNGRIAVIRYNADGSLDPTFDGDGIVTTAVFGGGPCYAYAAAIAPDGKIVIVGHAYDYVEMRGYYVVARYNTDGSLDTSFDGDGVMTTMAYAASAIAVQSDGKIVIGGTVGGYQQEVFTVIRLNANGSLDTGFDGDGVASTPILPTGWSGVSTVQILADGRIMAAGGTTNGTNSDFVVVRYNSNGSLDTSFDGDGKAVTPISAFGDYITDMAVQSDGRIVAAGYTSPTDQTRDLALVRYNPDGSLDTGYGTGGKAVIDLGYNEHISAIALDSAGKAVVTGTSYNFFTARITAEQATPADVIGRLTRANGQGIPNVSMVLTDSENNSRYTLTNAFGYYVFSGVPTNDIITVNASSKRFTFAPDAQTVALTGPVSNVDFLGTANADLRGTVKGVEKKAAVKEGAVKMK